MINLKKMHVYLKILFNPINLYIYLCSIGKMYCSDKKFVEILYKRKFGKKLNLENPTTFNEKLQWLKLYDRNDYYSLLVDKFEVKNIVSKKIGANHIIPTLGVYDDFNDINFNSLPEKFVIKCTHDSGGLILVKNKDRMNLKNIKAKINKSIKRNYYYASREWPYKNVKPRIIIEEFMGDINKGLNDYKFFCFNGICKFVLVCSDRNENLKESFYDLDWNILPFKRPDHPQCDKIERPINLELMISYAEKLSNLIPFVRIDFYEINKKVYFGEMTFYPAGGLNGFEPEIWDKKLGNMIDLSLVKKNEE